MDQSNLQTNNLVLYRKRIGYSQKQVASLLGHRTTSRLSHYEHGRSYPKLEVALSLEIILRVPVAFLFPGVYEKIRSRIRQAEEDTSAGQRTLL